MLQNTHINNQGFYKCFVCVFYLYVHMYELEYILFCFEKANFVLLVGYFLKAILNGKTHLSEKTRVFL